MAKAKFERTKPHINIDTIGRVDHGRMTLTAAITKVLHGKYPDLNKYTPLDQVDNASEERDRGITINVSHIECQIDKRHYVHADIPDHTDYIKNTITGAVQMDGVILAVITTDGLMAQTCEYAPLARQIGVPTILIALNKADAVDDEEMLELAEEECRDLLESQDFDRNVPIIQVFALKILEGDPEWVAKVEELMDAVNSYIPTPEHDTDKPFFMPVGDVSTITGRGMIVTGRIEHGKSPTGFKVEVLGIREPRKTTVTDIEMFHESMDEAWAGESYGPLLRGTERDEVERGQVVAVPGSTIPHTDSESQVYTLKRGEGGHHNPFFLNHRPQFYLRTTDVTGVIALPKGTNMVMPGDITETSAQLVQPIAIEPGLGSVTREGGRTAGSGRVTKTIK